MSVGEEYPEIVARKERKTKEVEEGLRQFLNHDGPKGAKEAYVKSPIWCKCGRSFAESCPRCKKQEPK